MKRVHRRSHLYIWLLLLPVLLLGVLLAVAPTVLSGGAV